MDAGERQRADAWFAEKWHHGPCPVCASRDWEVANNLGQIPNLLPFGPHGGNTVPVLIITCNTCGYTVPINAIVAGILSALPVALAPTAIES
jgi:hypothetical protein